MPDNAISDNKVATAVFTDKHDIIWLFITSVCIHCSVMNLLKSILNIHRAPSREREQGTARWGYLERL